MGLLWKPFQVCRQAFHAGLAVLPVSSAVSRPERCVKWIEMVGRPHNQLNAPMTGGAVWLFSRRYHGDRMSVNVGGGQLSAASRHS
jgi:hypothetical protein